MASARVLLWHWGRRGGGPRYTFELARALAALGEFEVHLSLSRQSEIFGDFEALGRPGWHVDTYSGVASAITGTLRLATLRRRFWQYITENRIDVVICTMSHVWNVAVLFGRPATVPYLLTLHDAVPHPGENYLVRQWLLAREIGAADGIVVLTQSVRYTLCKTYEYPEQRTWVIPLGTFAYHRADTARSYPRGRSLQLLFFGRLLPYKGLSLLLEAYRELLEEGAETSLMIAGPGDLSPYEEVVGEIPGVTVDNRWIPETEIAGIFAAADLVVVPYVEASQSGVIATAYASAIPVVATPVGGLIEQISHGNTGLVAAEVSAQALAHAMRRLMNDPGLYERCSTGALQEVRTRLSWPAVAAGFAEVIRKARDFPTRGKD